MWWGLALEKWIDFGDGLKDFKIDVLRFCKNKRGIWVGNKEVRFENSLVGVRM